jgi:hypothetical protein
MCFNMFYNKNTYNQFVNSNNRASHEQEETIQIVKEETIETSVNIQ